MNRSRVAIVFPRAAESHLSLLRGDRRNFTASVHTYGRLNKGQERTELGHVRTSSSMPELDTETTLSRSP